MEELHGMLSYLKLNLDKKQSKILFDEIDYSGNGKISYKEFKNFYDQKLFSHGKFDKNNMDEDPKKQKLRRKNTKHCGKKTTNTTVKNTNTTVKKNTNTEV